MKSEKFRKAIERHPYLRWILKTGPFVGDTMKPKHVHFIAVRPLFQLPRQTFSSIVTEGETSEEIWVEVEDWMVVFRIREDVALGRDPYRYCPIPLTEIDLYGNRVFHAIYDQQDAREMGFTPESHVREYVREWGAFYRKVGHITPEFVAVVNIKRSHGLRYMTFAPARVTIYQ